VSHRCRGARGARGSLGLGRIPTPATEGRRDGAPGGGHEEWADLRGTHRKIFGSVGTRGEPAGHADAIHPFLKIWCMIAVMSRTNIEINEDLIRKARKLTRLKTKRQIVDRALELLVRSESRKGILRYYGTGIWKGDLKASRRDRV